MDHERAGTGRNQDTVWIGRPAAMEGAPGRLGKFRALSGLQPRQPSVVRVASEHPSTAATLADSRHRPRPAASASSSLRSPATALGRSPTPPHCACLPSAAEDRVLLLASSHSTSLALETFRHSLSWMAWFFQSMSV
ncbi:hypothetical protein O181_012112 [Austropuccinia psidii MF-1]|uniref:Uncharacterized protein n=1 Tax=Austropuccinia psidii MF-1 TaxID=1389203 RepID=A0A9Q3BX16_9BASI|nr:hypothetical protein [Austropuccinia psidii MF-1]